MKAIVNEISPVRYIPFKLLAKVWKSVYWSRLSTVRYTAAWPEPKLPSPDWVRVRPILGGICGSDMSIVAFGNPPDSFAKAFVSSPFVMGHEIVGRITELGGRVEGLKVGDRVNIEPSLSCVPRGIDPVCPMCREGLLASCHNLAAGSLPPGLSIGFNSATGGAWSESLVAHKSQIFKVPDLLSDEQAVLVDPLACALHAVLRHPPRDDDHVLVLGAGIIGLAIVGAIRAIGSRARITILARYPFQRDLCRQRGADLVVLPEDYARIGMYAWFGRMFQTPVHKGAYGKPILLAGADVVYDAVGSRNTVEDSLRLVRAGGACVLVGMAHPRWVDWDPVTHKHLAIYGVHGRSREASDPEHRHTYQIVHEMMADNRLRSDGLLTHTFPLSDYRRAFEITSGKGRSGCVKAAFRI